MKSRQLLWAIGFSLSVLAAPAAAQEWETGLMYHFLKTDNDRAFTDDGTGFSLDTVWLPGDGNDGVSLHLSQTDLDSELAGADFDRFSATLGYWLYFTRPSANLLRPYLNAGAGYASHDVSDGVGPDEDGLGMDLGLGVVTNQYLLVPGLRARTEVRANYDDVFDGVVDYKVSLGLHYVFGGDVADTAPAPAEPTPAPVATPAPKPAKKPTPKPATADPRKIESRLSVYFATNSSELDAASQTELKQAAGKVKSGKVEAIEVVGHADSRGTAEHNKKLSERRAETVANFLVGQGLDRSKVRIAGQGTDAPVADNTTKAGRAKNRRVEVLLLLEE